ncbi:hypothetical protein [Paraburkholderia tropica]|uniref:hypothetical protein n=1 Tax=Paraburkholderia tropica TaxID=92647 RepID=UPI002AB6EB95|nr:hypothetical protein [Paraburkholderia tropica]
MNERIERTTVLAVYSAFIAACYLIAYWSRFEINIFQFAGITGFASLALYPLITAFTLNVLIMLVLYQRSNSNSVGPQKPTTRFYLFFKAIFIIWTYGGPIASFLAYVVMTAPSKWIIVLGGIVPIINWLADTPIAAGIAKDQKRRKDIVYWAFAAPFLAALAGATNAQTILDGRETRSIVQTGAAKGLQSDGDHPIAFLGFSGGTYFLYESKSGSVIMVNQSVAEPLTFQPRSVKTVPPEIPLWIKAIFHS